MHRTVRFQNRVLRRPVRTHPLRPGLPPPRQAGRSQTSDCTRAIAGAIACYHFVFGSVTVASLAKKWRMVGNTMNQDDSYTVDDYDSKLIRPLAFQIASNFIFCVLGIVLFIGIFKKKRDLCDAWLICMATMDLFVIVQGLEFNTPIYGIAWDVMKSLCEICIVWSFALDLKLEEAVAESWNAAARILVPRPQGYPTLPSPTQGHTRTTDNNATQIIDLEGQPSFGSLSQLEGSPFSLEELPYDDRHTLVPTAPPLNTGIRVSNLHSMNAQ